MIPVIMFSGIVCFLSASLVTPYRTKLIYYHSAASPFYSPTSDLEQKWEATISVDPKKVPLFLVEVLIGDHEGVQRLAFDTGASLTWVKCYGDSNYDPADSSTYKVIRCPNEDYEAFCKLHGGVCEFGVCTFVAKYSGHLSSGTMAWETFRFSTERSETEIQKLMFGYADFTTLSEVNGLFGLGPGSGSLMWQMDYSRFAYCIGNLSDPQYEGNVLMMDEDSRIEGQKAILRVDPGGHYNVLITQISVGDKPLNVVFPPNQTSTAILDTGASSSYLTETAYIALEEAVKTLIGNSLISIYRTDGKLCYLGSVHDLNWFPPVEIVFLPQLPMKLTYENLFQRREENVFCLGIESATRRRDNISLIGANLQQYFHVEFDLETNRMSMERKECKELWV